MCAFLCTCHVHCCRTMPFCNIRPQGVTDVTWGGAAWDVLTWWERHGGCGKGWGAWGVCHAGCGVGWGGMKGAGLQDVICCQNLIDRIYEGSHTLADNLRHTVVVPLIKKHHVWLDLPCDLFRAGCLPCNMSVHRHCCPLPHQGLHNLYHTQHIYLCKKSISFDRILCSAAEPHLSSI